MADCLQGIQFYFRPEKQRDSYYNIFYMNTNALNRAQFLLRNQELLTAYSRRLRSLSFTLALKDIEEGKDGLDPEERRSDENEEAIYRIGDQFNILLPRREDSGSRKDLLLNSEIFSESNSDDILTILSYKREQKDIFSSPFAPMDFSSATRRDGYIEFLVRLLSCYRVKARIDSVQEGILEYGVEPFRVPDSDVPFSVLDGIYDRSEEDRQKEIEIYLDSKDVDEDEEGINKASKVSIKAILTQFSKTEKERKTNERNK